MINTTRDYKIDNLKALLIFLVVFGHLLECFDGYKKLWLYEVIYSFHMPAFAFVTGYFAKQNARRIIKQVLYPYLIYQLLYLLFQRFYLKEENLIQFSTPYWILWYQLALFFWMLLIQVIDEKTFKKNNVLFISLIFALVVGYDKSIGYVMSLSRTIVLFPFFIMGHYRIFEKIVVKMNNSCILKIGLFSVIILFMSLIWHYIGTLKPNWFYHSYSYDGGGGYSAWIRLIIIFGAVLWILFLSSTVPNKYIPCITALGSNTLPVFLLHGFVVRWVNSAQLFQGSEYSNICQALMFSVLICFLLGNKIIARLLRFTFGLDNYR